MSSWISSWFGSSGSQAGEAPKPRRSMSDNATDTWRRLYAPGVNHVKGSDYYDNVKDKSSESSTWEYILKSEALKRRSFDSIDTNHDGFIDQRELAAALNNPAIDAAKLVHQADADKDRKLSRAEYNAVLDYYFANS